MPQKLNKITKSTSNQLREFFIIVWPSQNIQTLSAWAEEDCCGWYPVKLKLVTSSFVNSRIKRVIMMIDKFLIFICFNICILFQNRTKIKGTLIQSSLTWIYTVNRNGKCLTLNTALACDFWILLEFLDIKDFKKIKRKELQKRPNQRPKMLKLLRFGL